MSERVLIAPSILSADFGALREAVELVEAAGADAIHVDVMDGHFVPNLTIGPPVVKALKKCTSLPLDVHIMIDNPDETVHWYLDAGADWLTFHIEAATDARSTAEEIRAAGSKAGISMNPDTPVAAIEAVLPFVDLVLVMSVHPGFGGQSFIESSVKKIADLSAACTAAGMSPLICVDGGIDPSTAPRVVAAGARLLVAGSAVFCQSDPGEALEAIRRSGASALG